MHIGFVRSTALDKLDGGKELLRGFDHLLFNVFIECLPVNVRIMIQVKELDGLGNGRNARNQFVLIATRIYCCESWS